MDAIRFYGLAHNGKLNRRVELEDRGLPCRPVKEQESLSVQFPRPNQKNGPSNTLFTYFHITPLMVIYQSYPCITSLTATALLAQSQLSPIKHKLIRYTENATYF